jgi:hypothetical protein
MTGWADAGDSTAEANPGTLLKNMMLGDLYFVVRRFAG